MRPARGRRRGCGRQRRSGTGRGRGRGRRGRFGRSSGRGLGNRLCKRLMHECSQQQTGGEASAAQLVVGLTPCTGPVSNVKKGAQGTVESRSLSQGCHGRTARRPLKSGEIGHRINEIPAGLRVSGELYSSMAQCGVPVAGPASKQNQRVSPKKLRIRSSHWAERPA